VVGLGREREAPAKLAALFDEGDAQAVVGAAQQVGRQQDAAGAAPDDDD
jgi:hypothetical protein